MLGQGGLFRQENVEKRRVMSVREWFELCGKEDLRAPGVDDIGLHARATNGSARARTRRGRKARESATAEPDPDAEVAVKQEPEAENVAVLHDNGAHSLASPPASARTLSPSEHVATESVTGKPTSIGASDSAPKSNAAHPLAQEEEEEEGEESAEETEQKPVKRSRRSAPQSKEAKEAALAVRAAEDQQFLEKFDPNVDWLPPNTTPFSYTHEFCKELERRFWRNCGFGKPPWYGADMQGDYASLTSMRTVDMPYDVRLLVHR